GGGGRLIGAWNLRFTSGESPTSSQFTGGISTTIMPAAPAFDDAFWSTNNGSLYTVGTNNSNNNTYLIRVGYNGEIGNVLGRAALARSGGGVAVVATSPVTEFLTGAASNPDYVFVGGGSSNFKFMNRISASFIGSDNSPKAMDGSFAPAGGVISGI